MPLNQNPGYKSGEWYAKCDICDRQFYASKLRKQWDGLMACPSDFTLRNPQDFIRPVIETSIPTFVRPDDSQGEITVIQMVVNVPINIAPSLTDLRINYQTPQSPIGMFDTLGLNFPSANNPTYNGYSICLSIEVVLPDIRYSYENINTITPISGTVIGNPVIQPGTIATFRNYPASNTWVREH